MEEFVDEDVDEVEDDVDFEKAEEEPDGQVDKACFVAELSNTVEETDRFATEYGNA